MAGQSLPLGTTSNQNGEIQFKKLPFEETSPGSRKPNNRERIIQGQMGPHRSVYHDQLKMIYHERLWKYSRGVWSNIDHMYREVLGMNTDQVIVFRDGEL